MSKRNYSQYSNKKHDNETAVVDEVSYAAPHDNVDVPVPDVDVKITPAIIEEKVETVNLPKIVTGTVVGCVKLNVRAKPASDADVLCLIDGGAKVKIDVKKSNKDWVRVYTASGIDGYCMRKFVEARL